MEIITWACSIKCQVERSKTFPIFFPLLESNSELFKKPGLASIYNIMTLVPWSGSSVARPVSIRGKRRERCWMSLRYFFFFFLPISSLKKKKETQREILWFHSNRRNEEFTRTQTRNGWLCCAVRVIGVARRGGSPETIYRFPGRTSPEKKRRGRAQLVIIISFFFFCSQLLFRVITTCTAVLSAEEMENSQTGDPKKRDTNFLV